MKKATIIIFLAICVVKMQAQDYFIQFSGTGDIDAVGSVQVDNLLTGETLTLRGEDVLHLTGGIQAISSNYHSGIMKLAPNPMTDNSVLTFSSPEDGIADIKILDFSGIIVCQKIMSLPVGQHSLRISGITKGIYFVKVTGKTYSCSEKLMSNLNTQCEARIEYLTSSESTSSIDLIQSRAVVDMPYKDGDQLLFKGISGKFRTIVADVPTNSKIITFNFADCTDADNNSYSVVSLGAQTWMAENLNVGVRIDGNLNQTNNNIIEKYCYNDDVNNCNTYGGLYNCHEMMQYSTTPGAQGICPKGWHIPTDEEWTELTSYLGGDEPAGAQLMETGIAHWLSPKFRDATNQTGFTALPGGRHLWIDPSYHQYFDKEIYGYWWSSTESKFSNFLGRFIYYDRGGVYVVDHSVYNDGLSIRCLKD